MSAWYGIRPLCGDPNAKDQSSASRDHVVPWQHAGCQQVRAKNQSVYTGRLIRTEHMCRCRTIQRMVSLLFLAESGQLGEKWQRMA